MPQQINLHSPILLTPKRYFSAQALAASLGALALGLVALGTWATLETASLRRQLSAATEVYQAEKQRLTAAAAARPAPARDDAALGQELAQAERELAERRERLQDAGETGADVHRRSALLQWVAQTVPDTVWLTEVRIVDGQFTVAGRTLQPDVLRPWLERLATHPALAAQTLRAVKVEHGSESGNGGAAEVWAFQATSRRTETGG